MPIPNPNPGEHEDAFIQRCMGDSKMGDEYPDESQRYAVCIAQVGNERKAEILSKMLQVIQDEIDSLTDKLQTNGIPS